RDTAQLQGTAEAQGSGRLVPNPCVPTPDSGAARRIAAVDALVAGAAADHDRAAGRAWWCVFLVLDRRVRVGGRGGCGTGAVGISVWPLPCSSSRRLTPALYCASLGRNFDASQRKM